MGPLSGAGPLTKTVQEQLEGELAVAIEQRDALDQQIRRYQGAIAALNGDVVATRTKSGKVAQKAILAALGTFTVPVRSEDLLDHDSLKHYSRHTLRTALADLNHQGKVTGTRAPKGFIWDPPRADG
jgi:hypothetical protein